jgi:ribosomal protein S27E
MPRTRDAELWRNDPDFADVTCPDCGSRKISMVSLFGSAASEVMFQCDSCRACFNWIKWRGKLPPTARDQHN